MKYIGFMIAIVLVLAGCTGRDPSTPQETTGCPLPETVTFERLLITGITDDDVILIPENGLEVTIEAEIDRNGYDEMFNTCYVMREGALSKRYGLAFQPFLSGIEERSSTDMFKLSCAEDGNVQIEQPNLAVFVPYIANLDVNDTNRQMLNDLVDLDDEAAIAEFIAPKNTKERKTKIWVQHVEEVKALGVRGLRSNEIKVECPRN